MELLMTTEPMLWSVCGVLAGALGTMIVRRWNGQDRQEERFQDALEEHRAATEAAIKEFRREILDHLDRMRSSQETSLASLNQTMAEVARAAGEIRARMAERYATKEELSALEARMKERVKECQETCPPKCGAI
jgi:uncharacterized membrane-anchored protein YhcB (DUF1043 family)